MTEHPYALIKPEDVFNGIAEPSLAPKPTGCAFFDCFAKHVHQHGNRVTGSHAHHFSLTPVQLTHALRVLTGLNVHGWALGYCRLAAADLLACTDWDIPRIAERLGFGSVSAFGHFFQAAYSNNATSWRYCHQQRVVVQPEVIRFARV